MKYPINSETLNAIAQLAINEDVGSGDHSSLAAVPSQSHREAVLAVKDAGTIAGIAMAETVFKLVDPSLQIAFYKHDGNRVKPGDHVLQVQGNARSILTAERTVLNFMQRMSGIASHTQQLVDLVSGTHAKILDTRKTTPGLRVLEKWAVNIGGGTNHRFGLFDMIMLKDNHIDYAGGISQAVNATREYLIQNKLNLKIEVETRSINEVKELIDIGGVDIVMLDNMEPATMREAVKLIAGKMQVEASGGITEDNIKEVAATGVDFISIGALTHTVNSMDMNLKAIK